MDDCENIRIPEGLKEIDMFKKAIEVYLRGYYEYSKTELSEAVEKDISFQSLNDAEALMHGHDLRYDGVKLEYSVPPGKDEKYFHVRANGMSEKRHKKWQSYIGKKFEENDFKFFYF